MISPASQGIKLTVPRNGNSLTGGNSTIHSTGGAAGADFIGNYFGRDHRYGIFKGGEHIGTWSDNRWMDTGDLVSKP